MEVAVRTTIDAPREAVWDYLTHRDQHLEFIEGLTRWEPEGPRHGGLGARFLMGMRIGSVELGGLVEIVEFDPPVDLAWSGVTGVDQRGRWRLRRAENGGTSVELRLTYHAPGGVAGFIADLVASPIVRRNLRRSLDALKLRIEDGTRASSRRAPAARGSGKRRRSRRRAPG
jgi:uncharacterized membrane protein